MEQSQYHLVLRPQEQGGNFRFNGQVVMTKGFQSTYGNSAISLILKAIDKINSELVESQIGADYFQVFNINGRAFWIIDDVDHVTALLPEEY